MRTHSGTYTHSRTHMQKHTHTHTHSRMCIHKHTGIHKHIHIHTRKHMHAHTHTNMHVRTRAHLYTQAHTCTNRHTHEKQKAMCTWLSSEKREKPVSFRTAKSRIQYGRPFAKPPPRLHQTRRPVNNPASGGPALSGAAQAECDWKGPAPPGARRVPMGWALGEGAGSGHQNCGGFEWRPPVKPGHPKRRHSKTHSVNERRCAQDRAAFLGLGCAEQEK